MLSDIIERVNRLRKQAMVNPEFLQSAKNHEETLKWVEQEFEPKRYRKNKSRKPKTLSDIYENADLISDHPGHEH